MYEFLIESQIIVSLNKELEKGNCKENWEKWHENLEIITKK